MPGSGVSPRSAQRKAALSSANRPLETLRDGALKASIWENTRDGQTSHSVQFRRSYRGSDGQLRDSDNFFGADLLRLAHLASRAHDQLNRLREQARQAPAPEPKRSRSRDNDRER